MAAELYLGGAIDGSGEVAEPWRLEADRLRTHGVVVGMTGSGKTGFCLVMLEELIRAGVPVIAIDPKGDLGNLALLFPNLSGEEFAPWVEDGDGDAAAKQWRAGLERWGMGAGDVASLRDSVELTLFTPGSEAGVGVDVLGAFRRPSGPAADDADARRALVTATVSGLLGLAGRKIDPVRDPAHIVLSKILEDAWTSGQDPDLETLVLQLVDPPFQKVGVFPLDRFFPPDDRMDLAMVLNGILASPAFAPWTTGVGLDVEHLLARPADAGGRTRVSVFSLSHLGDAQRQFFLSILLGRVQAWSRGQPGTSDLRAVVFFDEVAGYLPPHPADPPTKAPLLTMMKQARAVGLGVVLATQNPVDVDYKGLSNAGLWAIGRLQTQQDRDRLLKGLGRPELDDVVQKLGKRQFVIQDAKEATPSVVGSRHAMCYLRGPFTPVEIARVVGQWGRPATVRAPSPAHVAAPAASAPAAAAVAVAAPSQPPDDGLLPMPPAVPGSQWFLDPRVVFSARMAEHFSHHAEAARPDGATVWRPALYAELELRFDEERAGFVLDHEEHRVWFPVEDRLPEQAFALDLDFRDLVGEPGPGGRFAPLPTWMDEERELSALQKSVVEDVYRTESRGMWVNASLKLYGKADESRDDFSARCKHAIAALGDEKIAKLKDKFDRDSRAIDDKIERLEGQLADLQGVIRSRQAEEVVNIGETVWALFSGRKRSVTTAMSKRRQTVAAQDKQEQISDEIANLKEKAFDLSEALESEVAAIRSEGLALLGATEQKEVRLEKNDIRVASFGVLWIPVTRRL